MGNTQSDPPELGPADVAPLSSTTAAKPRKPHHDKMLDRLYLALTANDAPPAVTLAFACGTMGNASPNREALAAFGRLAWQDDRFDTWTYPDGVEVVMLAGHDAPPRDSLPSDAVPTVPERPATLQQPATAAATWSRADASDDEPGPESVALPAAETKTLGEQVQEAMAAAAAEPIPGPGAADGPKPGDTVLKIASETQVVKGEQALAAMTDEERAAALDKARQDRLTSLAALSSRFFQYGQQAASLQADLNEVREQQKETAKEMAELCRAPIEQGIQMRIPGVSPGAEPTGEERYFAEGEAAAKAGKGEGSCPYMNNEQRWDWLDGWRWAKRVTPEVSVAIKFALTAEKLDQAMLTSCGLIATGEKPPVNVVTAWDRPHLVVGSITRDGHMLWYLQPLYQKDEWRDLFEDLHGKPIALADQTDEARDQRQTGGIDCGRVVKVGRKDWIVGPRNQLQVVSTPAGAEPAGDGDEPAPTGKDAAAGD